MRVFFGCLWFVFLFVGVFFVGLIGVSAYAQQGVEKEKAPKAAEAYLNKYAGPMAVAALIFSGLLAFTGILPGTRKRKPPAIEIGDEGQGMARSWEGVRGGPDPAVDRREPAEATRGPGASVSFGVPRGIQIEGSSVHEFSFSGFADRWSRIAPAGGVLFIVGVCIGGSALKRPGLALPGLMLVAAGGMVLLYLLWRLVAISRVEVGPEGVTWSGLFGSRTQPWDTIKEIWRTEIIANRTYRTRKLCLTFFTGSSVTFDQSISDFDSLAENVIKVAGGLILARKRAEMAETGEAKFGPAKLRRDGLELNGEWFDWQRLARHHVENGHLVVYSLGSRRRDGGDQRVPLSEIPNYLVLLHMLDERDVLA